MEAEKDSLTDKLNSIDAVTHSSSYDYSFIHSFIVMFIHTDGGGERLINS